MADVAQAFSLVERSRGRSQPGTSLTAKTKNAGRSARPRGHPSD
jgi:hypothetical protein